MVSCISSSFMVEDKNVDAFLMPNCSGVLSMPKYKQKADVPKSRDLKSFEMPSGIIGVSNKSPKVTTVLALEIIWPQGISSPNSVMMPFTLGLLPDCSVRILSTEQLNLTSPPASKKLSSNALDKA